MILIIKDINVNTLIQNISGIGTFLASLISLATLFVLIKQRKDSFRPQVIFGHRLTAKCISEDDNIFKTKWIEAYPEKDEENIDFCFEVLNVGVGVAENVIVKEYFDYKKALKYIKALDKDNEFIIEIDRDWITFKTTFDNSHLMVVNSKEPRELGTFLTRKQEKPFKYIFTDVCLGFLSCFDYLRAKHNKFMYLDKFPRCKYEIRYSDLEGKEYKSNYECKISSVLSDSYTFEFIKK